MVTNIQAISTACLHHLLQIQKQYGTAEGDESDTTTLGEVLTQMLARVDTGSPRPYRCPKCKSKGDYTPDVDGESIPTSTPFGNNPIANNNMLTDGVGFSPVRITCDICAGEGYTATQVLANPGIITYQNAP